MNSTGWIAVVVVVLLIIGGAWWYTTQQPASPATGTLTGTVASSTGTDANQPDTGVTGTPKTVTVLYGANGFSPSTVTINKGDTVTFVNNGAGDMWVASNPHPVHTGYDGTNEQTHCAPGYTGPLPFDECSSATSFSFMFNQVGTWGYHNHDNHDDTGTVIVQ